MGRFDGFENEVRGPWDPTWYGGVVIAEYETSGNFAAVHKTEDKPTQAGDSRNLKLCVRLVRGEETKDVNYTVNYRPEALSDERIAELKSLREKYKGQQTWPDKLAQRDNLGLTKLHELEKAGIPVEDNGHGGFDVEKIISVAADFRLGVFRMVGDGKSKESEPVPRDMLVNKNTTDEERARWFNRITAIAPVDTKTNAK